MLLKLIISLHALAIVRYFVLTEFVPRINCSNIVDVNCECSFLHEFVVGSFRSFVELECVKENDFAKRVSIKNERNEVSITCHGVGSGSEHFYHLIPELNIDDTISDVTIDCPMNNETTIKNITDHMAINSFEHLEITIDRLFENLFKDALNIKKLDVILAQNGIEIFPTKFLSSLSNLELFHFKSQDGSGTTLIESGIFYNQGKLKSVQFVDVVIKKLDKEIFAGAAASIINLEFRYSMIELITADAFENLGELTTLKFYFARITTLPDAVLRRNQKLKDFYSKSNALISGELLANLTSLRTVDISLCASPLPANLFTGSSKITSISLTHIDLGTISSEILNDQIELMELDLSYNALSSLPSTIFRANKKLSRLNLGYNVLQNIPDNLFASTEQLAELNLEFNEIQQISNGISCVDFISTSCWALMIFLSLDILPETLTRLRLNGNKLITIDDRILNRLTGQLQFLFIQSNAFVCECDTNFLRLIEIHSEKLNVNSVECRDGDQLQTMRFLIESCR